MRLFRFVPTTTEKMLVFKFDLHVHNGLLFYSRKKLDPVVLLKSKLKTKKKLEIVKVFCNRSFEIYRKRLTEQYKLLFQW